MKKLFFLFVMMLVTSLVMAQTNKSVIIESGVNQTSTVDQQGEENESVINQSNRGNVAGVMQVNYNLLELNTVFSDILQTGRTNEAKVEQIHNGDLTHSSGKAPGELQAFINQAGNGNSATQIQGPHGQMGFTKASSYQEGNSNTSLQMQVKYGNEAYVVQTGNGNSASQGQDTELPADAEGSMNYALVHQSGNTNVAEQEQHGWTNNLQAYQSGNGNIAYQEQTAVSWVTDAYLVQSGNSNNATQLQNGNLNSAYIDQQSNGNTAYQDQLEEGGKRASGYVAFNRAEITQLGGSGNMAEQMQTSTANALLPNFAVILQDGASNTASQTQWGGDNWSSVSQSGSGHSATVTQSQSIIQP